MLTYADLAPLDWFHLRGLLWDGWPVIAASAAPDWTAVARAVNSGLAADSAPVPAAVYRRAFERLAEDVPELARRHAPADLGHRLWNRILYTRAQGLFGRPVFMNLGYLGEDVQPRLDAADEPFRLFVQLYERTLRGAGIEGRRVLEIGCGGGGGCDYIRRYHRPSSMTGLDLEEENLATCRQRWSGTPIRFVRGTAEVLPFPDASFDVVVNIESSGHYARPDAFFADVRRVLAPGGRFHFADLRPVAEEWGPGRTVAGLARAMHAAGLRTEAVADITASVRASVALQDEHKQRALEQLGLDPHERRHFEEIMLCHGSRNGGKLLRGELQYWTFVCEPGD